MKTPSEYAEFAESTCLKFSVSYTPVMIVGMSCGSKLSLKIVKYLVLHNVTFETTIVSQFFLSIFSLKAF